MVAHKDQDSSPAQQRASPRFAGCEPLPTAEPARAAPLPASRRWQWERRGRRREAADRRLRLRLMAALPPCLGSEGSWGARGVREPELASGAGTCARRRWGAACERRRRPARGEPPSRPGWLRRPSSSRWVPAGLRGVAGPGYRPRGRRAEEGA